MTVPAVDIYEHDQAVLDALAAVDRPVGFAEAPDGALDSLRTAEGPFEYIRLDPIDGLRGPSSGNDSEGNAELVYQTTIIGRLPEGVRSMIAPIETALRAVEIPGRAVVRILCEDTGRVDKDEDLDPEMPVFYATPRWRIWTGRATS